MHADIREHRGAAAVAVRLARNACSCWIAERRSRRRVQHAGQLGPRGDQRVDDVVHLPPRHRFVAGRFARLGQPRPGRTHGRRGAIHLEKALGAGFVIDERAFLLGGGGYRQHELSVFTRRLLDCVQHDHRNVAAQRALQTGGGNTPEQIVFQHHQRARAARFDSRQRAFQGQAGRATERAADAVHLRHAEKQRDLRARRRERLSDRLRSPQHRAAARTRTADDQGRLRRAQRRRDRRDKFVRRAIPGSHRVAARNGRCDRLPGCGDGGR